MIPYCLNMGPSILVITGGHVDGLMVDGCLQFESENLLLRDDSASVDVMLCVLKCLLLTINAEDDVKDQG